MKICIFDSWNGKFSQAIREHWESLGHEVVFNGQYNIPADVAFFYQSDNAAQVGVKESLANRIYTQCVDIEVWAGQPFGIDWSKVSGCFFMAQHIKDYVESKAQFPHNFRTALIKPGIDLNKFTLKKTPINNIRKIAYVVGNNRIWDVKRFDIALWLLRDLMTLTNQPWELHVRGTYSGHIQYNDYCEHLIENLELENNIVWYRDRVEDLNQWLEDKDYFFLSSTKEAFSYATAEAMAKGIKPVLGNWRGASETWGPFYCKTYKEMLETFLNSKYEPEKYRDYVSQHYNQERYFSDLDKFMLGGEHNE